MLGASVLALVTVTSCALRPIHVDRRVPKHGLEAPSNPLPQASINRRGSVDDTTTISGQGSDSYSLVVPLCSVTQCADPNLNDTPDPRKRKRPNSTSSDDPDAAPPPAQMARLGSSGDSNSGSTSELVDAGPYPWSKLSVPGRGKKNFAEAALARYNHTQWYLRVVPTHTDLREEPSQAIRPDLRRVLPRPGEAPFLQGLILRTVEDKMTAPFSLYQIIPPRRLMEMFEAFKAEHDDRLKNHDDDAERSLQSYANHPRDDWIADFDFPDRIVEYGEDIYQELADDPSVQIREVLGDPVNNAIALDARIAYLFDLVLSGIAQRRGGSYVMATWAANHADRSNAYHFLVDRQNNDPPTDKISCNGVSPSDMTVDEALQLRGLFKYCMDPSSPPWRAANITVSRLIDALRTHFPDDPKARYPKYNGPKPSKLMSYMTVCKPLRHTSAWEWMLQLLLPSFEVAYVTLNLLLLDAQDKAQHGRKISFIPSDSQSSLLASFHFGPAPAPHLDDMISAQDRHP